jgi:D-beta-D-heptose 7-phosphate kinase/D-beta-D-heptose 1-phosphate adenosyltransferase
MMDEYLWGSATRISPESPVMVVDVERESSVPGGAANVVNNLLALGAHVSVLGVVGTDAAGVSLKEMLSRESADISGIVCDPTRPTTRKTRVVAQHQQVLRVDRERAHPLEIAVEDTLLQSIATILPHCSAAIISDYNKGVLTDHIARECVHISKKHGLTITANPKPTTAHRLAGVTALSLNKSEAEMTAALGSGRTSPLLFSDEFLDESGHILRKELKVENLLVTRGAKGLSLWPISGAAIHVPAHEVEVYDVAGAGDTVISMLTLALAAGANMEEALILANHAAACVVRKVGVAVVTVEELYGDW